MKKYINSILCAFVFLMAVANVSLTQKAFELLDMYEGKTGEFKITDFYISDSYFSDSSGNYRLVRPGLPRPQDMPRYAEAEYEGLKIYVPGDFEYWEVVPIIEIPKSNGTFDVGVYMPTAD